MIDVQSDGRVFRRTGAAHAAEAVVADQDGGAQAPVQTLRRAGRNNSAARSLGTRVDALGEIREGQQRLVPGTEALLIRAQGVTRQAMTLVEVAGRGLSSKCSPDVGDIGEQVGLGNVPEMIDREAGRREG